MSRRSVRVEDVISWRKSNGVCEVLDGGGVIAGRKGSVAFGFGFFGHVERRRVKSARGLGGFFEILFFFQREVRVREGSYRERRGRESSGKKVSSGMFFLVVFTNWIRFRWMGRGCLVTGIVRVRLWLRCVFVLTNLTQLSSNLLEFKKGFILNFTLYLSS